MKRFFITGTDTDCGKTYVTAQLIKKIPGSIAIKPIASGCEPIDNILTSSDAQELVKYNSLSPQDINPWRFSPPVSPHLAAKLAHQSIKLSDVSDYCLSFSYNHCDTLFIEGAGGLMVPLYEQNTWIDFLQNTLIPTIVVVGMKLGCINHALLTVTALRSFNLPFTGWIANCIDPHMLLLEENIHTISTILGHEPLATVPYKSALQLNTDLFS